MFLKSLNDPVKQRSPDKNIAQYHHVYGNLYHSANVQDERAVIL